MRKICFVLFVLPLFCCVGNLCTAEENKKDHKCFLCNKTDMHNKTFCLEPCNKNIGLSFELGLLFERIDVDNGEVGKIIVSTPPLEPSAFSAELGGFRADPTQFSDEQYEFRPLGDGMGQIDNYPLYTDPEANLGLVAGLKYVFGVDSWAISSNLKWISTSVEKIIKSSELSNTDVSGLQYYLKPFRVLYGGVVERWNPTRCQIDTSTPTTPTLMFNSHFERLDLFSKFDHYNLRFCLSCPGDWDAQFSVKPFVGVDAMFNYHSRLLVYSGGDQYEVSGITRDFLDPADGFTFTTSTRDFSDPANVRTTVTSTPVSNQVCFDKSPFEKSLFCTQSGDFVGAGALFGFNSTWLLSRCIGFFLDTSTSILIGNSSAKTTVLVGEVKEYNDGNDTLIESCVENILTLAPYVDGVVGIMAMGGQATVRLGLDTSFTWSQFYRLNLSYYSGSSIFEQYDQKDNAFELEVENDGIFSTFGLLADISFVW